MTDFDYFVIFADRRTGSNFLEANINAIPGLTCHGEAFNPKFIGYPNGKDLLGMSLKQRSVNPTDLLTRVTSADGLNGFRYFNGHEARVFDTIMTNPRCAKIILTRNPLDSFVSLEIARTTKQWKLTDVARRRAEPITFDPSSYERHIADLYAFHARLRDGLHRAAQSAFYVSYDDLQNVEVINAIARYLGCPGRIAEIDTSIKRQNPEALAEKILNYDEMIEASREMGWPDATGATDLEPQRGASVHTYLVAPKSRLIYQVLRSGPTSAVADWMAKLDDVSYGALLKNFTPKALNQWKLDRPGHRSFTVVRHPVARIHAAFCDKILATGPSSYPTIRQTLSQSYQIVLPTDPTNKAYDSAAHRAAFMEFLRFVKLNLAGKTAVRIDPHWASQANTVRGFSEFASPDAILREERLEEDLAVIAAQVGHDTMPRVRTVSDPHADRLREIYDTDIEKAVADVYQRDYVAFGYGPYLKI